MICMRTVTNEMCIGEGVRITHPDIAENKVKMSVSRGLLIHN